MILLLVTLTLTGCFDGAGKKVPVDLNIQVLGLGIVATGNEQIGITESVVFQRGATISLTVHPESGWYFAEWQGPNGAEVVPKIDNEWSIYMESSKEITAVFKEKTSEPITITGSVSIEHTFPWAAEEMDVYRGGSEPQGRNFVNTASIIDVPLDEVIIRFDSSVSIAERNNYLTTMGYEVLDTIDVLNAVLVKSHIAPQEILDEVPPILYIEQNRAVSTLAINAPNDPLYSNQWNYRQIRLPQAWSITTGDERIRIAVVDTGIDHNHPDLKGKVDITTGYNFVDNNSNALDDNWHGTHVAGIIGASTNNSQGIAGVMWDVTLVPVKVLDGKGDGDWWNVSKGILYAAGLLDEQKNPYPADVINISLGGKANCSLLEDAVVKAHDAGVILVAASGNSYQSELFYPARYPEVIAVGAVDYNYPFQPQRAPYSNYGEGLNIMAPGGNRLQDSDNSGQRDEILSTNITYGIQHEYRFAEGTSMAAPHVSGIIGLMLSAGIPHHEVQTILQRTAMTLIGSENDVEHGYGLVNAYWAVNNVEEIRIIMGTMGKSTIVPMAQTVITDLTGGGFSLEAYTNTDFQVFAWIDVNKNKKVDAGDYLGESVLITYQMTQSLQIPELLLREVP